MAFKICHLIVILSIPLMAFYQNRYPILSNLHSCWRQQVQTRLKQSANNFTLGESTQCRLQLATRLRVKDNSLSLSRPLSQFISKSLCVQQCLVLRIMDFLDFANVLFLPNSSIGELCEDLNTIVGKCIWYNTFQVQNTKWLWLVNNILTIINSDNVLCASFGLYPSYVAGILNSVK